MQSFRVKTDNGKVLDYRLGSNLDLNKLKDFLSKKYSVKKIWQEKRHAVGFLEKDGKEYFLKVSTSEGISEVTKNEFNWNEQFNKLIPRDSQFWVPQNYECGFYQDNLFYIVTDVFNGPKLAEVLNVSTSLGLLEENMEKVIDFTEKIQSLKLNLKDSNAYEGKDYREKYLSQVDGWFNDIPAEIREKFKIIELLKIVQKNISKLTFGAKHGDFAPWHLIQLQGGKLGIIDGERAMTKTIEHYDICYVIQRIFTVLQNPRLAQEFINSLRKRKYDMTKLKTVLASRAIGGFLDEYLALLSESRDFSWSLKFKEWVLNIT
jgi:hypothetical protein